MSYPSDLPRSSASKKLDKVGKRSKTAGFYSKGLILWETWASPKGSTALWLAGVFGVLLTSLYIFRVIFLVFFGDAKARVLRPPDTRSKFRWWFSPFSRW